MAMVDNQLLFKKTKDFITIESNELLIKVDKNPKNKPYGCVSKLIITNGVELDELDEALCKFEDCNIRSCWIDPSDTPGDIINLLLKHRFYFYKDIMIYYPFHVLYRIDDVVENKFYIGICESRNSWPNYFGGGKIWRIHMKKHPLEENKDRYKKTVLREDFKTPNDLRKCEVAEIKKFSLRNKKGYCVDRSTGCMNIITTMQNNFPANMKVSEDNVCKICGGKHGQHFSFCGSEEALARTCKECGGTNNNHKSFCKSKDALKNICKICGGTCGRHKATCPKYRDNGNRTIVCTENENCKAVSRHHKKNCPKYDREKPKPCDECGSINSHKEYCSKFKSIKCNECGGTRGKHRKGCGRYISKSCPECGGLRGKHRKICSKYKPRGLIKQVDRI